MKCELWKVHVSEGVIGFVHSEFIAIKEIFIPKFNMAFNSMGFAFKADRTRYRKQKKSKMMSNQPDAEKLGTIDISAEDLELIIGVINQRQRINRLCKKYFDTEPFEEEK